MPRVWVKLPLRGLGEERDADKLGMLRIVRFLSCAVVAAAIWLSVLQLNLPSPQRFAILLV